MPDQPINERQKAFCREYLIDFNGTQAAIRAGYSARSAKVTASRMLTYANVRTHIAELQAGIRAQADIDPDTVLRFLWAIVTADPNEVISHRVGACRHCHGIGHHYQWRTPRELEAALAAFEASTPAARASRKDPAVWTRPDDRGGFGFAADADPDPDCPECDGLGLGRVVIRDTTLLSPQARLIYNGIRTTSGGQVQVLLADRQKALVHVARILGMFDVKPAAPPENAMAAFLRALQTRGSMAPLATGSDPDPIH